MSNTPLEITPEAAEKFISGIKRVRNENPEVGRDEIRSAFLEIFTHGHTTELPDPSFDYAMECIDFAYSALDKDPDADTKLLAQEFMKQVTPPSKETLKQAAINGIKRTAESLVERAQDPELSEKDLEKMIKLCVESIDLSPTSAGHIQTALREAIKTDPSQNETQIQTSIDAIPPEVFEEMVETSIQGELASKNTSSSPESQKHPGEPEDEPLKQPDASMDVLIAIRRHLKREMCGPEVEEVILTELPGWLSSKNDTPQKTKDNNTGLSVGLKKVAKVIAAQERGQALNSLHTVREILADPAVNTSRGTPQEKGCSTPMISSEVVKDFGTHLMNEGGGLPLRNDFIEIMAHAGPKAAPFDHKRTRRGSS